MSPDNARTYRSAYALSWIVIGGATALTAAIVAAVVRLVRSITMPPIPIDPPQPDDDTDKNPPTGG